MLWSFPKIYPILDASVIPTDGRETFLLRLASGLADAGVTLLEYRNKTGTATELIADAAILRAAMSGPEIRLVLDDRVDLVEITGFNGVHVDAGDLSPADARRQLGSHAIVGTFGGSDALVPGVLMQPADYFSIGPVGSTITKQTTTPPIGVEGVKRLREQAGPAPVLVAVGGISLDTAIEVLEAGASTVAVSATIFRTPDPAAEFRRWHESIG
jgi:thiamine-phosphate pyrophosphorylase